MTSRLDEALSRLPHQPPMRWIHRVLTSGPEETVCELYFDDAAFFGSENAIPAAFGLEMLAQASAVHLAVNTSGSGKPAAGQLVRCRSLNLLQPALPVKTAMTARVRLDAGEPGSLCLFRGYIEDAGGTRLVEGDWAILTAAQPAS